MITAKFISLGFLSIGIFMLMQVLLPVLSFRLWEIGQKVNSYVLKSPKIPQSNVVGITIDTSTNFPAFISTRKRESVPYQEFSLTIPKISLYHTDVYVDSNDLNRGLVHLPGTALPGERGNVFISGHSAISRFFSKGAYFAKLPDLKKADQIEVLAGGNKFVYEVLEIKAVNPTDLSPITPPDDQGRYITLMTCVPPGLNFKRLIVLGKMI